MNMYPVEYKIIIFEHELHEKPETIYGITFAESYTKAMKKIEQYYGDSIIEIKLFMLEEGSIYELHSDNEDNMIKIHGDIVDY